MYLLLLTLLEFRNAFEDKWRMKKANCLMFFMNKGIKIKGFSS